MLFLVAIVVITAGQGLGGAVNGILEDITTLLKG
jgi:Flp pilus assembly pilin Flp